MLQCSNVKITDSGSRCVVCLVDCQTVSVLNPSSAFENTSSCNVALLLRQLNCTLPRRYAKLHCLPHWSFAGCCLFEVSHIFDVLSQGADRENSCNADMESGPTTRLRPTPVKYTHASSKCIFLVALFVVLFLDEWKAIMQAKRPTATPPDTL